MPVIKKLQFSSGVDVTAPTDLSLATSTTNLGVYADDTAFEAANGAAQEGDTYLNSTSNRQRIYIGGAWRVNANQPVNLASEVTGTLPIANGGTGQTTASGAINALVPTQTGQAGKFLTTNGSVVSWDTAGAGGTASPTTPGQTTSYFPLIQSSVLTSSAATINITTTDGYQIVRCENTSTQTVNLPAAAANDGRVLHIINVGAGNIVTIDADGSETINGDLTNTITAQNARMTIISNGTYWDILSTQGDIIKATLAGISEATPTASTWYDDSGTLTLPVGNWLIYSIANLYCAAVSGGSSGTSQMPIAQHAIRVGSTVIKENYATIGQVNGQYHVGISTIIEPVIVTSSTTYKLSAAIIPNSGSPTSQLSTIAAFSSFYAIRLG